MPGELQSQRITRAFGLGDAPVTCLCVSPGLDITLVDLDVPGPVGGESLPMRSDDAFLLLHFMNRDEDLRMRAGTEPWNRSQVGANETLLVDLASPFSLSWSRPMHALAVYVPRQVVFDENPPCREWRTLRCEGREDDAVLAAVMGCVVEAASWRHARHRDIFLRHMVLAACARLAQLRGTRFVGQRRAMRSLTGEQQRHALDIMRERVASGISIRELAKACGVAHSQFVRMFKRSFGVTPRDWLMARRLELALDLMSDRALALTEIAARVGFSDSSQFCRLFVRCMGWPPGMWRREVLGMLAPATL
jgi:AraC-like DNA-binding protein